MPDFHDFLVRFPAGVRFFSHFAMNGQALCIGICGLVAGLFNAVVLAIFSYLYWDVVPANMLGRFNALSKNVALIAGLVWSFFIFGHYEKHPKMVYVGTGLFSLSIYLLSVWRIKEGEYPPPDERKTGGALAPIRAYFVECFSEPFYLWIFSATCLYQLGNASGQAVSFFVRYDLKLDAFTVGWADGWAKVVTTTFGMLAGFYVGAMTDRLKPVRLMAPCYLILALIVLGSYFFIHDRWTYLVAFAARNVMNFMTGIVVGAFTVEVFPLEKLGQFCSAQAVFYQVICNVAATPIGMLFDHLHHNRLGFLWTATFYGLASLAYAKVYFNWKARQGRLLVPHAG